MKYAVVEIDDVDYAEDATTALRTGDAPTQTLRTLVPDGAVTDTDTPVYSFQLAGAQGGTLWAALYAAQGTVVDVVLQAEFGVGKTTETFSVLVPLGSVPFGGQQGGFRVFDITMPVQGAVVKGVSS
jgi:hypothetical protein